MALIMTKSPTVNTPSETSRAASSMHTTMPMLKIIAWPEFSTPSVV